MAERDAQFASARTGLRAAKTEFETALQMRTAAAQEINALLQARPRFAHRTLSKRTARFQSAPPGFAALTRRLPLPAQAVVGV